MFNYINNILNLIDTDEKRIKVCEEPSDIFLLGYYYSKIDKWILINFKDELEIIEIKDIAKLVSEEDFFKFYEYIVKVKNLAHSIRGKYSF